LESSYFDEEEVSYVVICSNDVPPFGEEMKNIIQKKDS